VELAVAIDHDDGGELIGIGRGLEDREERGEFAEGEIAADVGEVDGGFADDVPEEFGGFEIDEGIGGDSGIVVVGDIESADESGRFRERNDFTSGGPVELELLEGAEDVAGGRSMNCGVREIDLRVAEGDAFGGEESGLLEAEVLGPEVAICPEDAVPGERVFH